MKHRIRIAIATAALAAGLGASTLAHAQRFVAIAVNGPHPTLAQTEKGFREELVRQGFAEGKDIVFTQSMGNFNPALIPQLLAQAESRNPALLFTITTPVSQAARGVIKNQNLPIVFGIVSDPIKAGIVPSWEKGSDRYVGVSNLHDMEAVLAFGKSLFPKAKAVGLPFNPGEANDVTHTELAKAAEPGASAKVPDPVEAEVTGAQQVEPADLDRAVEEANQLSEPSLRATNRRVVFGRHEGSGRITITIHEQVNGKEVERQIPPESLLKLVERLKTLGNDDPRATAGSIVETKA